MVQKTRFEKWEKIRQRGRWYFVFVYGVLGWGLGTGGLMFLVGSIMKFVSPATWWFLLIFLPGGFLWGEFMWRFMEFVYSKDLERVSEVSGGEGAD
ncbi:MAG: hypothetical protein MUC92_00030 [Fimbriimonadaceae bacterium]|nr:hypothetical protein [Fimbriimonadaceae bacterium]